MADLFTEQEKEEDVARQSLATRMRPISLEDVVGQKHLLAKNKLLRRLIDSDRLSSAIFYGPPGTGKTTLARAIAQHSQSIFIELSGVESSVADLRKAVEGAEILWRNQKKRTLLLVDEIHRFNKAQQDALLPHVEKGAVRFIGITTHNPFFYVNAALVSRSQIFEFKRLEFSDIIPLLQRALADQSRGLGEYNVKADDKALKFLAEICDGDARQALNALEVGVLTTPPNDKGAIVFDLEVAQDSIQKKAILYDADGDAHYDTISAFIKSVRAGEPDAALYWLGKMLIAGEDIRFIARRLVILAAEDIGMADPRGIMVAVACQQAVEFIGMPEARIPLAEATVYLATAPKSNASYMGIESAMSEIQSGTLREVPKKLKSTAYNAAKTKLGHGKGYQYAHSFEGGIAPELTIENLPQFYQPTDRGYEKTVAERLAEWKKLRKK
ncbi:MAG: replication-associated recombination protein A [Verrucomicrobiota bacterium]